MGHLSEEILGFPTTREGVSTQQTVGTSSGRLVDANPNRLFLYLANVGTNDVYVAPDAAVGVQDGFLIAADGGTLTFQIDTDGDLTAEEFHAIADGGNSTLVVRSEAAYGSLQNDAQEA